MTNSIPGITHNIHSVTTSGHRVSRQRGFTLVEVMLSAVLIAAVAALSVPSYQSMVEKRLPDRNIEQIDAFLNSVQNVSALTNPEMHSDSSEFDLILRVSNTDPVTVCSKTQQESISGHNVCS